MTVSAWRIVKASHASSAFSGDGARRFGGRWNNPGAAPIYVSGSISLAMLEIQVHVELPELLRAYALFEVTFDEKLIKTLALSTLPKSWQETPAPASVKRIGDAWAASGESAILKVPSAIVPTEFNYLLNPAHADFSAITIGPKRMLKFDTRMAR